jgi:hypothetical protein
MDITNNNQKTTRKYTKRKETRKPRCDKGIIKDDNYNISGFLEHNPDATTEDIIKYRLEYRKKYIVINRFCKTHPKYTQEEILKDLPFDSIENLKNFRPLYWAREKEMSESPIKDFNDCKKRKCNCPNNYDDKKIFDECQNLRAKKKYLRTQINNLKEKILEIK